MGVNLAAVSFLVTARARGVSFDQALTIGRQNLYADAAGLQQAYAEAGSALPASAADSVANGRGGYVDQLFAHLGARHLDSLDASRYENATIVHDLNQPLPDELRRRYSLVLDGGSLEHVFNFPQALKNCMDAVAPGGHFVAITPANNQFGHGFYQFSPEVFYRALSPENGFDVDLMLIRASHRWAGWKEVSDPQVAGTRVELTSPWQSLMFVLARRVSDIEPFRAMPEQSDYAVAWVDPARQVGWQTRQRLYGKLPAPLRRAARLSAAVMGTTSNRSHFKPVAMADLARRS